MFRKRFANNWQLLASYNWNDGEGNTNSDSNADFQGDVLFLDPRAPNQYGTQPGLIRNIIKGAGSYTFDMGLQLGATMSWNCSGEAPAAGRQTAVAVSRRPPAGNCARSGRTGCSRSCDRATAETPAPGARPLHSSTSSAGA